MMHIDHGHEMMNEILQILEPVAKLEREPKKLARRMTMIVVPKQ